MRKHVLVALLLLCGTARADFLTPSPYLAFDDPAAGSAVSPFAGMSFGYFHLETFEDGFLNTPGVEGVGGSVVGPGDNADSVDEDDGAIDGSGTNGRSYFNLAGATGVRFDFSALLLGGLPTHAGIVWTDGAGTITFSAFDASGTLLGTSSGPAGPSGSHNGQTDEDTFFGIVHASGISRIEIRNSSGGIEVDHLQYGAPIPEPETYALLLAGLGLLGFAARRRSLC